MKYVQNRLEANNLQTMMVVVLHGVNEKIPGLKAMGWVEDQPHDGEDEAVVLHEPLYFMDKEVRTNGEPVAVAAVMPNIGVPISTEFFTYNKVEIYEGVSVFGVFYIETLLKARSYKPKFALQIVPMPSELPKQMTLPTQR
jgi:hypothetical protein